MFVGKARGLPDSGAPEICFTWVGPGLAHKHLTRLEKLARDKHSSLLQKSVKYSSYKFFSTGPRILQSKPLNYSYWAEMLLERRDPLQEYLQS
jgi:hypothetical protein